MNCNVFKLKKKTHRPAVLPYVQTDREALKYHFLPLETIIVVPAFIHSNEEEKINTLMLVLSMSVMLKILPTFRLVEVKSEISQQLPFSI